jgi:hypothetical protein
MMDSRVILPKCLRCSPAGTPCSHARTHTLPPSLPRGSGGRGAPAARARVREELGEPPRGWRPGPGPPGGPGARRSRRLGPPGGARREQEAAAGAGSGGAREKAAAPGLAQTPAPPPSPGTGGPPRPLLRRCRRASPQLYAPTTRAHPPGLSRSKRPPTAPRARPPPDTAPGRPRPCPRPPLGWARLARKPGSPAAARSPPPPPPLPDAHPRPRLPGAERLLSARPPPRHTHTFSSFSELEHRSGREGEKRGGRRAEEGGGGGGAGAGGGERRRRRPAPPGRLPWAPAAAARLPPGAALASPARLPVGTADPSFSRALGEARGRSGHSRRRGGAGPVDGCCCGPRLPPTCGCWLAARAW